VKTSGLRTRFWVVGPARGGLLACMVRLRRIPPLLAALALLLAGPAVRSATLPVSIDDHDGRWRTETVQKEVLPGIDLEAVVIHLRAPDRLIFFSSRLTDGASGTLATFAQQLKDSFTAFHCTDRGESEATRMGFAGRDLRFELANATQALDCELFVFSEKGYWWGVLHANPRNGPGTAEAAFALLHKTAPPPPGGFALKPFRVRSVPVTEFPISIGVAWNAAGTRVVGMVVNEVPAGSATERAGVKAGDAIVAIDGRKVGDFTAGVGRDDELGRLRPGLRSPSRCAPGPPARPTFSPGCSATAGERPGSGGRRKAVTGRRRTPEAGLPRRSAWAKAGDWKTKIGKAGKRKSGKRMVKSGDGRRRPAVR
jgi:hypothetical protein